MIFGGCDVSPGRGAIDQKTLQKSVIAYDVNLRGRRFCRRRIVVKQAIFRCGDMRPTPGEINIALKEPVVAAFINPTGCSFSRFSVVVYEQI